MNSDPVDPISVLATVVVGVAAPWSKEKKKLSCAETNAGLLATSRAAANKAFLNMATF